MNTASGFCRYLKVRIDQVRLKEISGVKRSTMDKLLTQMGKIVLTMQGDHSQLIKFHQDFCIQVTLPFENAALIFMNL